MTIANEHVKLLFWKPHVVGRSVLFNKDNTACGSGPFYGVRLYKADNISQINTFLRRLIFPLNRMRCGAGGEGGLGNLLQY